MVEFQKILPMAEKSSIIKKKIDKFVAVPLLASKVIRRHSPFMLIYANDHQKIDTTTPFPEILAKIAKNDTGAGKSRAKRQIEGESQQKFYYNYYTYNSNLENQTSTPKVEKSVTSYSKKGPAVLRDEKQVRRASRRQKQKLVLAPVKNGRENRRKKNQQQQMDAATVILFGKDGDQQNPRPAGCARHDLVVDFADIGWSDFIVAPKSFDAHYCAGSCRFPLSKVTKLIGFVETHFLPSVIYAWNWSYFLILSSKVDDYQKRSIWRNFLNYLNCQYHHEKFSSVRNIMLGYFLINRMFEENKLGKCNIIHINQRELNKNI